MSTAPLDRRVVAEALGTALLLAAVVGSGIMGERLAGGNAAVALLANTLATGAALVALILTFGPISGAHLNPAVTLSDAFQGGLSWREVPPYVLAQVTGAFAGVAAAHVMFGARSRLRLGSDVCARVPRPLRHERDGVAGRRRRPLACSPGAAAQSGQTGSQGRQSTPTPAGRHSTPTKGGPVHGRSRT